MLKEIFEIKTEWHVLFLILFMCFIVTGIVFTIAGNLLMIVGGIYLAMRMTDKMINRRISIGIKK